MRNSRDGRSGGGVIAHLKVVLFSAVIFLSGCAAIAGESAKGYPTGLNIVIDDGDPVSGLCEWRSFRLHCASVGDVDAVFERIKCVEFSADRKTATVAFTNGDILLGTYDLVSFDLQTEGGTVWVPIEHIVRIEPEATIKPVLNTDNGHWYAVVDEAVAWEGARVRAKDLVWQGMSGHLATLTSREENEWVEANVESGETSDCWWLGGYQYSGREPDGAAWLQGRA